jgi:hypothetical protein
VIVGFGIREKLTRRLVHSMQGLTRYWAEEARKRDAVEAVQCQRRAARLIPAGYLERKRQEMEMRRAAVEEVLGPESD